MDLEVVGRHALLFDDDSMAAFVNSSAALVEWNSLSIDRYDVRHFLSAPPPPRSTRRRRHATLSDPDVSLESELDLERYFDLPSSDEHDLENEEEQENAGGYRAVPFLYGNPSESTDQKNTEAEAGFLPPFSVPEHLRHNLPPTEKVHQIIAKTAMFVSKHGGQSEIVLRVKQGDNPTFGFLMPDHDLHPYFRFLIDHQELLKSDIDGKSIEEENRAENGLDETGGVGGALSLLGSVYGSGEDEEGATEDDQKNDSEEAVNADSVTASPRSEKTNNSVSVIRKDDAVSKHSVPCSKEGIRVIKRNHSISTVKAGTKMGFKNEGDLGLVSSTVDKLQASALSSLSKVEPSVLEPPSDLKRAVDKIVEFILRNGKEFEAVLVQQDTKHGRFPFLLPSNQYYPYYIKVLRQAQESRLTGKGVISEKPDSLGRVMDKKTVHREGDSVSLASDIPFDSERKGKFKMVIGKSKKDGQDPPPKATQPQVGVNVDAAAAAAILQAATKGIKNPSLELLSKTSINGIRQGPNSEGGEPHSFSSLLSSQPQSFSHKMDQSREPGVSVPVAKAIAKTAALAAASEADSSEASLTREQKLKAERLRRAKIFAAMIKTGAAPLKGEPSRGLSVEPPESGFSGSGAQVVNVVAREREASSGPLDVDSSDKIGKSEKKASADGYNERRLKRRYRSRSKRDEEEEEEEEEEGEEEKEEKDEVEDDRDLRHSKKKRRSHRSSHHKERHKHRNRPSSKDKYSGRRQKHERALDDGHEENSSDDVKVRHSRDLQMQESSSHDEHGYSRHRYEEDSSSNDGRRHSRHRHKHDTFSNDEFRHSQHRRKHDSSSDDEHRHSRRRHKHSSSSDDEHQLSRNTSSDDEHRHSRHRCKHGNSSDDEHQRSRHWRKQNSYYDDEHQTSRHRHKLRSSDDDEYRHQIESTKYRKISHSEREADLEEGEILTKSDQSKASEGNDSASREASVDVSKSYQDVAAPPKPSEPTEVSNDLRAKIRAMLMATL